MNRGGDRTMWADLQTMNMAYQEIAQGERPWNALGDFLNYWYCYAADQREDLVREPLQLLAEPSDEVQRWAAFCAATVEFLCKRYEVSCPAWVMEPVYDLNEPWFHGLGAKKPHVQARLTLEAPEPFRRRNIFCSERAFQNKYEMAAKILQLA